MDQSGQCLYYQTRGKVLAGPLEAEEGIFYADLDFREIYRAKRLFDVAGHDTGPDVFQFAPEGVA